MRLKKKPGAVLRMFKQGKIEMEVFIVLITMVFTSALILLLVFTTIGIIVSSAAVAISIINSQAASKFSQGQDALALAESGAENAIIRLLRDPNYFGETLNIGGATVTITVAGGAAKTIQSKSQDGDFKRTIQVEGNFTNNLFTVSSWQEI